MAQEPITITVCDASSKKPVQVVIQPDQYGFTIDVAKPDKLSDEYRPCELVVDFDHDRMRVFRPNQFGDVVDPPLASLDV